MFAALTACDVELATESSGSTNTTQPPVTVNRILTGTIATDTAIDGTVTVVDAEGNTLSTQADTDSTYSVNLQGRPGPYLIRFDPSDNTLPVLYSYATNSGVANITQFTSLALVLAFQNLEAAFNDWITTLPNWDRAALEQALATINANFSAALQGAGVEPTIYDLFTAPFVADQTNIDAFLDDFAVTVDYTNNTYTITDNANAGQSVTFDTTVNTDSYYIGALFTPVPNPNGDVAWQLTFSQTLNGVSQPPTTYTYPTDTIPWSKERFDGLFWGTLPEATTQTFNCDDSTVTCDITLQISQLDTSYIVTGTGEVGTTVEASAAYSWSITGTIRGPALFQTINESTSWSYSWKWERIS